jgi:hypothetical protein
MVAAVAQAEPALDRERLVELAVAVVKVEATGESDRMSIGSGVVVADERVVTNCHVLRGSDTVFVLHRGQRRPVRRQAADREHDLCVLQVPGLRASPATLGEARALRVGQPVFALGYEGGMSLQFRTGIVRALHAYDGSLVVESTTPFTSGASGGALFDGEGRLVAVLTYRLRGDRRSYFSVPVEWFTARLTADQQYLPLRSREDGAPFWQRSGAQLPYFLRAHQLETGNDWRALQELSDQWARAETHNAEPWIFRGKSLIGTHNLDEAMRALKQALALDPSSASAWLHFGRVSVLRGSMREAQDALVQLSSVSPELARCLALELDTTPTSEDGVDDDCQGL